MRIALVIATLGVGGAERVLTGLANELVRNHSITLITLNNNQTRFYPLSAQVGYHSILVKADRSGLSGAIMQNMRRINELRYLLRSLKPDVVISFIDSTNIITLLASIGTTWPVVVSERVDPRYHRLPLQWGLLRLLTYRYAAAVVVQTHTLIDWAKHLGVQRVRVISNPVSSDFIQFERKHTVANGYSIAAMGRLVKQKGFDLLLEAFAIAIQSVPVPWRLIIIGTGNALSDLQNQAERLKITMYIDFMGQVNAPAEVLCCAEIFVLSSRFEGYPNALCEAMALGMAVISFDCPSGPAEIIEHNINDILVEHENVTALASAMRDLMNNPHKRTNLGRQARLIKNRLNHSVILSQWESVFSEVVK